GALKRRAAPALRRIGQVEEIARREAERVPPAAPGGEVAQGRETFLDVVETERQRMPGVAQLSAPAHRWCGHGARRATDPDRRVRPLRGPGRERRTGEAHVLTLVRRDVAGPPRLDRPEIVIAPAPALPERQAEGHELRLLPAPAHAGDEAPPPHLLDRGRR